MTIVSAVVLLVLLTVSTGCARKIVLHPIDETDYFIQMKDGVEYHCFSKEYFNDVLMVQLEEA